jgi:hypothetical protein
MDIITSPLLISVVLGGALIEGRLLAGAAAFGAVAMMPKVVGRYTPDVDESGVELGCAHG